MICDAIRHFQHLSFTYDDYHRVVEPHTYGTDSKGHYALRAYQVRGGSESGELGWKIFHTDEMRGLTVLAEKFSGPRHGYKRGDSFFDSIQCQL